MWRLGDQEIIAGLGGDVKPKSCDADEELQNHAREAAALSDLHAKVTNLYERVISCNQSLRAFRGVA